MSGRGKHGADAPCNVALPRYATVLLYEGVFSSALAVELFLRGSGIPFRTVSDEDLVTFRFLPHHRLFIFPAGHHFGPAPETALGGPAGRANLQRAVAGGMNYLGICAGAFAATAFEDYPVSHGIALHLTPARPRWPGETGAGVGFLTVRVSPKLAGAANLKNRLTRVWYHNGPIFVRSECPAYRTLASFEPTVEERKALRGSALFGKHLKGSAAIAESRYGQGRVMLCPPHFELGNQGIGEYQALMRQWLAAAGLDTAQDDPLAPGQPGRTAFMEDLGGEWMEPVRRSASWRVLATIVNDLANLTRQSRLPREGAPTESRPLERSRPRGSRP